MDKPRLTRATAEELPLLMADQADIGTPKLVLAPDQFIASELKAWRDGRVRDPAIGD